MSEFLKSISAGILIAIGGSVYLACDIKYVGAVVFSVALLCICFKGYSLYTGKVGFLTVNHEKKDVASLCICLLGNTVSTLICGVLIRYALPESGKAAAAGCTVKLSQTMPQTFVRALFCGVLMYLAVSIYKEKNTALGIVFCVPAFILAGFEHSIADMFYFGASGIWSVDAVIFIITVIVGNSVGGVLLPLMNFNNVKRKQEV